MKKHSFIIAILFISIFLVIVLVGCGSDKNNENINHNVEPPQIEQPEPPLEREIPWNN